MSSRDFFMKSPPVFLLGTQRSGTTLLTKMLSSHPKLHIQNELPLQSIFTAGANKQSVIDNFDKLYQKRYGKSVCDFMEYHSKIIWGLKDPQLTEHIKVLKEFLPGSKFIVIVRDPRAVVNSYMNNRWGLGTTAYTGALRWCHEVSLQDSLLDEIGTNGLHLRYEDLVNNPEEVLRKVCRHLNIPFSDHMLKQTTQATQIKPNESNINTTKKPSAVFATKWKQSLSERQVREIESLACKLMTIHDYQILSNAVPPSFLRKLYYTLHQTLIGEIQLQYQLKRVKLKGMIERMFS